MTSTLFMQRIFAIYDFIMTFQCEQRGNSPSRRLMADYLSMNITTLNKYLDKMERMGMIERAGGLKRGIRLLQRKANWNALVTPEPGEMPPTVRSGHPV